MTAAQYRLVVRQGPNPGQVIELTNAEITIGRDIGNDIVINDPEVSRKHAHLTLEGDRYKIEDLNSTNGTYVDGQRLIGPHVLAIGEILMFGDNIGMVFDGEPASLDETIPSHVDLGATPVAAIPVPLESHPQPLEIPRPEVMPLPPQPEMADMAELPPLETVESGPKPINSWLLAGCGCVIVIIILIAAVWVFIDQPWNPGGGLYCVSPFDIVFRALGFCP